MYLLKSDTTSVILNDWSSVISHSLFQVSDIYEFVPKIGWVAL